MQIDRQLPASLTVDENLTVCSTRRVYKFVALFKVLSQIALSAARFSYSYFLSIFDCVYVSLYPSIDRSIYLSTHLFPPLYMSPYSVCLWREPVNYGNVEVNNVRAFIINKRSCVDNLHLVTLFSFSLHRVNNPRRRGQKEGSDGIGIYTRT